jgi:DNA-binding response OmpR family regulator
MMDHFEPILFLESSPRIRSLFDSFWGMESVQNLLVNCDSESAFWKLEHKQYALLIVDVRMISGEISDWMKKLERERPQDIGRIIWVVETKEERDRWTALGVLHVLRLPFQWSQWLPVIKKMGLRWNLWKRE